MRFEPTPRPALAEIPGSLIREVSEVGRYMPDVIPLWFGEPDTVTPDFVREAAKAALDEGKTFYAPNPGIPPLREAIAAYLKRNNRPVGTARVAVTASGVNALMLVAQALLSPGDRVVIPAPAWPNMDGIARVMGAEVTDMPLRLMNGIWRADLDELLAAITPETKLLFLNSPGNPTGWTLTAEQDRVVSVNYFSKSWAMTGWRLGWIVAPPALMDAIGKLNEFNMSSAPTFIQHAGVVALDKGDAFIAETRARYLKARDIAHAALSSVPGITAPRPDGAMYLFLKVEGCADSLALAKSLLHSARVGIAPGAAFGAGGEGHLRLCFAQSEARIREASGRLAEALTKR
ncbi:MAG: aminotransferase class I/II-fold pyridoxal phosphate-dependent enzyme [Alphaproteobacteria bacterium]|nr:aminotransferase class I/II-fold pyridoxal phosphate-dependent enzyme [Alphaproteobacteria bacterium]